jgi:class 3 adenylate cyclase
MTELPTGTVTFLFTDIEGSTHLLQALGERYRAVQDAHSHIVRRAIAEEGGAVVRTEGDSFFAAFVTPAGAVRAAVAAQRNLSSFDWPHRRPLRARMGIHTGEGAIGGATTSASTLTRRRVSPPRPGAVKSFSPGPRQSSFRAGSLKEWRSEAWELTG